jgi:hypothetical protein
MPWTYIGKNMDDAAPAPLWFEISTGGRYFADVHVQASAPDTTEAEANARLMCASPAMLVGLRAAQAFLRPIAATNPDAGLALMQVERGIREATTAYNREDEA